MNNTTPEECIAQVMSVSYSSSIALVTFALDDDTFTLYGDRRMISPILAYIGKLVSLRIVHSANWSWEPQEEPNEEVEDE